MHMHCMSLILSMLSINPMCCSKPVDFKIHHIYTVAELPSITTHPEDSIAAIPGSTVTFTVKATGTEPLNYQWQWNPAEGRGTEKWEPCSHVEGFSTATLIIPNMQKSSNGSFRCVISDCVGSQTSKPAKLEVS